MLVIAIVLFQCIQFKLYAQASLKIGDPIPNAGINNIVFPDDKLIILDFWATWCKPCIRSFAKLDSIQNRYKDNLKIVLVNSRETGDSEAKINTLFDKYRKADGSRFKFARIIYDTILTSLFPYTQLPHYVWLFNKKVVAITGGEAITVENLENALAGESISITQKQDVIGFDKKLPLIQQQELFSEFPLLVQSTFTGYLPGLFSGAGKNYNEDSSMVKLNYYNNHLLGLFSAAIGENYGNRVVTELKDSSLFFHGDLPQKEWLRKKSFCYEILYPATWSMQMAKAKMLEDLTWFTGIKARIENRRITCYVLRATEKSTRKFKSKGGESLHYYKDDSLSIINKPLSALINILNEWKPGSPIPPIIIDETNYKKNIDLQAIVDRQDIKSLQKQLKYYDIELMATEREMEVLVLKQETKIHHVNNQ